MLNAYTDSLSILNLFGDSVEGSLGLYKIDSHFGGVRRDFDVDAFSGLDASGRTTQLPILVGISQTYLDIFLYHIFFIDLQFSRGLSDSAH
jgi:hypothetical protein